MSIVEPGVVLPQKPERLCKAITAQASRSA